MSTGSVTRGAVESTTPRRGRWTRITSLLTNKDSATFVTCFVLVSLLLVPTVALAGVWLNLDTFANEAPPPLLRAVIASLSSLGTELERLNAILLPLFAVIAGLQAKGGMGSAFFLTMLLASLLGLVTSILCLVLVPYSPFGEIILNPSWMGQGFALDQWRTAATAYFKASSQTFLTFVSILLGLRVADAR